MAFSARALILAAVICAVPSMPAIVDAQSRTAAQRGQQAPRGQQGARGHLSPSDIQDQFDAYAIVQAQDALNLSDAQYPQFVRRARELHALRRRARAERGRLVGALNQLLRQRAADESRLDAATRALDAHDRTSLERVQKAYAAVDEILDVRQRARFRVLEEQLERKKLDMLFRARQGRR